jgi:phosphatidate phosphatase APP1
MKPWERVIITFANNAEEVYDEARARLRRRLGVGKIQIIPYIGHGNGDVLYLRARVLKDKGITAPTDNDTLWANLLNTYKRYNSTEIKGAQVRVTFGNTVQEYVTDDEGYIVAEIRPGIASEKAWHTVALDLIDYPGKRRNPAEPLDNEHTHATGQIIVPPTSAQFGIISDIDDTVLRSGVQNLITLASNTFLNNARTRLPFEGVAAFYQALQHGTSNTYNPIFYVSSSPWNLYDMIVDFFQVRGIPLGSLHLIDLGITENQFISPGHREHKTNVIQHILKTHLSLPFVLIGDSSQKDPEIYEEIVKSNPGRIRAVYIRDVTDEKRDISVRRIIESLAGMKVPMIFVPDTYAAALHAAEIGLIAHESLPTIRVEKDEDKAAPTPLEEAIRAAVPIEVPAPEKPDPSEHIDL